MAIAKMKKMMLISHQSNKDTIMQTIQGVQSIELIDLSSEYEQAPSIDSTEKARIEKEIKGLENEYDDLQSQLHFLQEYLPKKSMLAKMREPRAALTMLELEEKTANVNREETLQVVREARSELKVINQDLRRLQEEEDFLSKWQKLTYVPNQASSNDYVQSLTGTIPQTTSDDFIRHLRESHLFFLEEVFQTKEEYGVTVVFDAREQQEVRQLLEENHFFRLEYPFSQTPKEEITRIQNEIGERKARKKAIQEKLSKQDDVEWSLKLLVEMSYSHLQRLRGKLLLIDEPNLFVLEGWIEAKKVPWIQEAISAQLSLESYALLVDDVKEEEYASVPIVLENNKFVAPFENITAMYSMPKYNEIDPTPFLMPFYFVFFGMMVADAGYGLLMLIATTVALKFFHLKKGMQKNMQFFQLLSYATIMWGLIYGSFFGLELPIVPLSIMDDVNTILLISVVFGVIQILLGLGIKTYLYLRDGDLHSAVSEGIGWLTIFAGIILLVVANLVIPNQTLSTVGGGIAILGAVAIIVASALATKNKALGVGVGLYNLYGITGYVGDIVSYTRLMALGVSGGSIGLAFNMIIEFLPPAARFTVGILLFIVLHAVNIGLSSLSAYVHGARLMFVEFFGKFYEGGGKSLEPLRTSEEYIDLKNNFER
ncbi:V-type ATP synthase subunit I [Jeotgalibaca caeni]|uniref:V-type ATP synthase subunit I n=1 Tax=Jeotgalibaca caeni TaxID=3028623 RepID=UPI00237E2109|nr:V-type ATP synthase subunit I [Jeotgalibaca caeni]MDE1548004.1 V-type ATP synthase subunit I [Jeotgalibaca caeni]